MPETTNLRQGVGRAHLTGIVSEKDLKVQTDDNGKEYIGGFVTVKTSDVNFVRVGVRVNRLKNDGTENGTYKGMETVMNEYQSIADVGEENATKVSFTADVNPFTGKDGNAIVGYRSNFFNRQVEGRKYENKSELEIELFISAIVPEMANGEETGRALVKGWFPTYNGIEPITLVGEGEVADALYDYEPGQTVKFYADIINNRVEHRKEIPMRIGKPRVEITYENKNDLLITGSGEPYEVNAWDASAIKLAIQERENRLEERKNRAANRPSTGTSATGARPSGASRGRSLGF